MSYYIGLDIGTTTISAVCLDQGSILSSFTRLNDSSLPGIGMQDPNRILDLCHSLLRDIQREFGPCRGIGITCQMHGIMYVDENGFCVSPLYTWENDLGNRLWEGVPFCQWMTRQTGFPLATGYGLVTHAFLSLNNMLPASAVRLCTIGDYVGMRLCNLNRPLIHPSNAASFGLFLLEEAIFSKNALQSLGADASFLPDVSEAECVLGFTEDAVPVSIAIGDNQASYLGAQFKPGDTLLNFGTGSQISVSCSDSTPIPGLELRPYLNGQYLLSGACLCGGSAYAALKNLFRAVPGSPDDAALYNWMEQEGRRTLNAPPPVVDTRFKGTRSEPDRTGSIQELTSDNLTPGSLVNGVLRGMCQELYAFYQQLPEPLRQTDYVVVSGNGARKNKLLQEHARDVFALPVRLAAVAEEAAAGAAKLIDALLS